MTTPVTRHCHICGLTHLLGPSALETECTIALKAEVARLRGVLEHVRATDRMLAEAEYDRFTNSVVSISNDPNVIIDATWPKASTA